MLTRSESTGISTGAAQAADSRMLAAASLPTLLIGGLLLLIGP